MDNIVLRPTFEIRNAEFTPVFELGGAQFAPTFGKVTKTGIEALPYTGPTTVTPTQSTQILETRNLIVNENITVEPIPNCYGLISWHGSVLTVS